MDEHETSLDIRRGSSSTLALVSFWAPSVVATLLSVLLYANDMVEGWTAMTVLLLSLLRSVLIYVGSYIYSRSVTLDDRGYIEKAAIAGYELWREEYELIRLVNRIGLFDGTHSVSANPANRGKHRCFMAPREQHVT